MLTLSTKIVTLYKVVLLHIEKRCPYKSAFLRLVFSVQPSDIFWSRLRQSSGQIIFTSCSQCRQRAPQNRINVPSAHWPRQKIHSPLDSNPNRGCNERTWRRVDTVGMRAVPPTIFTLLFSAFSQKCTSWALALFVVSLSLLFVLVWFVQKHHPTRARVLFVASREYQSWLWFPLMELARFTTRDCRAISRRLARSFAPLASIFKPINRGLEVNQIEWDNIHIRI